MESHLDALADATCDWRNIPITLTIRQKGEGKAHACAIAHLMTTVDENFDLPVIGELERNA